MNEFPVTTRTIETLKQVMDKQDQYGIKKYGKPVHHSMQYDWLSMFFEEMADGLKYIQCEIERKSYIVDLLEAGMRSDNPKDFIEVALDLLKVKGTGK